MGLTYVVSTRVRAWVRERRPRAMSTAKVARAPYVVHEQGDEERPALLQREETERKPKLECRSSNDPKCYGRTRAYYTRAHCTRKEGSAH